MQKKIVYITAINALLLLALCQIMINSITALNSSSIGFYMFGFIVGGLITMAQISKINSISPKYWSSIISFVATIIFGLIFIYMILTDDVGSPLEINSVLHSVIIATTVVIAYILLLTSTIVSMIKEKL